VTLTLITRPPARPARRKRTYTPTGAVGQHLARAAALQAQIQQLQAEYDTERAWLLSHMQQRDLATLALGETRCTLKSRNRWTYSRETQLEMERLSVTQKWEQSHGIATNTPSYYVALTSTESMQ
jgi:hypothetical protein